ncbi:hypothetical protein [Leptolyngbya sp. FACHB-711]|nr:hypothetical protein [Leptolyngbya sp. FACHB-711]MBD1849064.1 hypothetical protein [Cyanobacteria bacterium FACHB-502]MBD2024751.1 hypothetical protein [Leptolyngbya sp. FACHB-711]
MQQLPCDADAMLKIKLFAEAINHRQSLRLIAIAPTLHQKILPIANLAAA